MATIRSLSRASEAENVLGWRLADWLEVRADLNQFFADTSVAGEKINLESIGRLDIPPYSDQPVVIKAEIERLFRGQPHAALREELAQIRGLACAAHSDDRVRLARYSRQLGVAWRDFDTGAGLERGIQPLFQHRVQWHR